LFLIEAKKNKNEIYVTDKSRASLFLFAYVRAPSAVVFLLFSFHFGLIGGILIENFHLGCEGWHWVMVVGVK
jgi:hypothetical protein